MAQRTPMVQIFPRIALALTLMAFFVPVDASGQISGIRISQTGNTGLTINVDVTAFYTTGSTETTA